MMSRALKAFPGMVMSVLLAGPAFASNGHPPRHADDHPAPRRTAHVTEHRRPALAMVSRAGGRVTAATRGRRTGRGIAENVAYRSAPGTSAYLSDATVWSNDDGGEVDGRDGGGGRVYQTGMASWYGGRQWQGRRMSSGDRFDEAALTAAHATLPLGSRVRVALASGARSVVVTITDRPGTRRRIIDLSRAAAAELGILDAGVARVALIPQ